MTGAESRARWEARYGAAAMWTGKVNSHLKEWVDAHPQVTPGVAIEMACGVCGDAMWLASQGWQVTGVDFAQAAIDRASAESQARGVDATWIVADLTKWKTDKPADLVTLSFLHEPVHVRTAVWRAAAGAVAEGGTLLITGHAPDVEGAPGPPPETRFTAEEVLAVLGEHWHADIHAARRDGIGHHAGHVVTDVVITLTR
jgi:hypothetical protein